MSWRQKQEWAADVMVLVPRGDHAQNEFRMILQTYLYRALGSNPGDVPQSLAAVIQLAVEAMRTIAGHPGFEPVVDSDGLHRLSWPTGPFEVIQRGIGPGAQFQLRRGGATISPWRSDALAIARDLRAAGGERPPFIDRTGPECATSDDRRISWDLLAEVL